MSEDPDDEVFEESEIGARKIPGYLEVAPELRDEARRAYVLLLMADIAGTNGKPVEIVNGANLMDRFLKGELPDLPERPPTRLKKIEGGKE